MRRVDFACWVHRAHLSPFICKVNFLLLQNSSLALGHNALRVQKRWPDSQGLPCFGSAVVQGLFPRERLPTINLIVATAAVDGIRTIATHQKVVTNPGKDDVVQSAGKDFVVAGPQISCILSGKKRWGTSV